MIIATEAARSDTARPAVDKIAAPRRLDVCGAALSARSDMPRSPIVRGSRLHSWLHGNGSRFQQRSAAATPGEQMPGIRLRSIDGGAQRGGETPAGDFLGDPFDHRRHLSRDRRLLAVRNCDWWQVHVSGMAVCLTRAPATPRSAARTAIDDALRAQTMSRLATVKASPQLGKGR